MKSPITGKEMTLITRPEEFTYRNVHMIVQYKSFLCADSGETFTTIELDEINMNLIIEEYKLHNDEESK